MNRICIGRLLTGVTKRITKGNLLIKLTDRWNMIANISFTIWVVSTLPPERTAPMEADRQVLVVKIKHPENWRDPGQAAFPNFLSLFRRTRDRSQVLNDTSCATQSAEVQVWPRLVLMCVEVHTSNIWEVSFKWRIAANTINFWEASWCWCRQIRCRQVKWQNYENIELIFGWREQNWMEMNSSFKTDRQTDRPHWYPIAKLPRRNSAKKSLSNDLQTICCECCSLLPSVSELGSHTHPGQAEGTRWESKFYQDPILHNRWNEDK